MTKSDYPGLLEKTPAMTPEEARIEAHRCLYCFDAPCIAACPTHIDIPRFIKQIAHDAPAAAGATIFEANPLGHSCARVCPVEVLCAGACVYLDWHKKPIEIGRLQRVATDHYHAEGLQPFSAGPDNGKRVAVVGSGPAGLSAAAYLRRLGCAVTIFESRPKPGGLNTYGVAEYKLDQKNSLAEAEMILELGVEVRYGVRAGETVSFESLGKDFDAVFLGVGLGPTSALGIPGEDKKGVFEALEFIEAVKEGTFRSLAPKSETTLCIGAGNTSIDVVTQSRRTGVGKVVLAYRRGPDHMTAYGFEVDLAKSDGVEFLFNAAPVEILGSEKVSGVRLVRTRVAGGKVVPIPGSEFEFPCDRVVKAIGQTKMKDLLAKIPGIELDEKGRIKTDPETLATSNPKFFAGGDAVNGGKEVVNAAADGKRAALGIFKTLFPGREPGPEHRYWIETLRERRSVRPAHGKKQLEKV